MDHRPWIASLSSAGQPVLGPCNNSLTHKYQRYCTLEDYPRLPLHHQAVMPTSDNTLRRAVQWPRAQQQPLCDEANGSQATEAIPKEHPLNQPQLAKYSEGIEHYAIDT